MLSHLGKVSLQGAVIWSWITPPCSLNSTQFPKTEKTIIWCAIYFVDFNIQELKFPKIDKTTIYLCFKNILPKINLEGAQTSNNLFLYPFITQWYTNFSTVEQFCCNAILLQPLFKAAVAHSVLEVGHDSTFFTVSTASLQYLLSLLHTCMLIK